MALSPTIPTSFVPKQPVRTVPNKPRPSGGNALMVISFFILGLAVVGCVGVFLFQQYLGSVLVKKEEALKIAEERITTSGIEEFIRLSDRLTTGKELLENHIALSQFLTVLESSTLANVRFSSMSFVLEEGVPTVEMVGVARTFNALAAQSNTFGANPEIKSAIFSGITVNPGGSVSFIVSAKLTPEFVTMSKEARVPAVTVPVEAATSTAPVASSTAPVATTTSVGL